MRQPMSPSIHSTYRPLFQSMSNPTEEQRDGPLSRRDRNRRALAVRDNLIFNPLRRPRDRLYQEIAERHRAARQASSSAAHANEIRARVLGSSEPKLGREEKPIRCTIVVCHESNAFC